MITVVSGTNRIPNNTSIFAKYVCNYLRTNQEEEVRFLDLATIDPSSLFTDTYREDEKTDVLHTLRETYFSATNKYWFFVPEYNGSIPGILKLLIDAIAPKTFEQKKACITGTATGRAGNLRGMDHLSDILNHLKITVLPNKLPISSIHTLFDVEKGITDASTKERLENQAQQFLTF